jgi:hypothetical protein
MPLYNPPAITGNLLAIPDNTHDIGADGEGRPKSLWLAGNVNADGGVTAGGEVLGATLAAGTNITAGGYVNLSQIADPGAPASNTITVHARDNGGSSTLGLRCEQAVAVDVVAASTHTLTVLINNTAYKILLST